jgi:nitroreductase
MDVLEAIHTRRSIRKYENRPVPDEAVEQLLSAAMTAPSACNGQPWQFIVIDDRAVLDSCAEICPNAAMILRAPLAILVCGDLGLEKSEGYWTIDCSAAVENMLLGAHGIGLGACWCGVYPRQPRMDGLGKLFGLPDRVIAHSLVVIGYPAQEAVRKDRYRADRVHRNRW